MQRVSCNFNGYYMIITMMDFPATFCVLFTCCQRNKALIQFATSIDFVLNLSEKSEVLAKLSDV